MSLVTASLMKSSVFGVMPRAELTPVFSPMDCAKAEAVRAVARTEDPEHGPIFNFLAE